MQVNKLKCWLKGHDWEIDIFAVGAYEFPQATLVSPRDPRLGTRGGVFTAYFRCRRCRMQEKATRCK